MMQYMSQAFFFYIKTGALSEKSWRKIYRRKNEKNQNTCVESFLKMSRKIYNISTVKAVLLSVCNG